MRTPTIITSLAIAATLGLSACTSTTASAPTDATTLMSTSPSAATGPPATSAPAADGSHAALEAAVRRYSVAYFAGDATTAYGMLSKRCTTAVDKDVYAAAITTEAKAYGKQPIKTVTVDQLSGNLARVSYTYSVPLLNQKSQPWVREGGVWHWDSC